METEVEHLRRKSARAKCVHISDAVFNLNAFEAHVHLITPSVTFQRHGTHVLPDYLNTLSGKGIRATWSSAWATFKKLIT